MTLVSEQTGAWLAHYSTQLPRPRGCAFEEAAIPRFSELGFPTTKNEEWRFTNVAPVARTKFPPTNT